MGGVSAVRATRVALAGVCLASLMACSSSIGGTAVKVKAPRPVGSADAVVTLMNTGPYATAAGRPLGAAGDNPMSRGCWKPTATPNMSYRRLSGRSHG